MNKQEELKHDRLVKIAHSVIDAFQEYSGTFIKGEGYYNLEDSIIDILSAYDVK